MHYLHITVFLFVKRKIFTKYFVEFIVENNVKNVEI